MATVRWKNVKSGWLSTSIKHYSRILSNCVEPLHCHWGFTWILAVSCGHCHFRHPGQCPSATSQHELATLQNCDWWMIQGKCWWIMVTRFINWWTIMDTVINMHHGDLIWNFERWSLKIVIDSIIIVKCGYHHWPLLTFVMWIPRVQIGACNPGRCN